MAQLGALALMGYMMSQKEESSYRLEGLLNKYIFTSLDGVATTKAWDVSNSAIKNETAPLLASLTEKVSNTAPKLELLKVLLGYALSLPQTALSLALGALSLALGALNLAQTALDYSREVFVAILLIVVFINKTSPFGNHYVRGILFVVCLGAPTYLYLEKEANLWVANIIGILLWGLYLGLPHIEFNCSLLGLLQVMLAKWVGLDKMTQLFLAITSLTMMHKIYMEYCFTFRPYLTKDSKTVIIKSYSLGKDCWVKPKTVIVVRKPSEEERLEFLGRNDERIALNGPRSSLVYIYKTNGLLLAEEEYNFDDLRRCDESEKTHWSNAIRYLRILYF